MDRVRNITGNALLCAISMFCRDKKGGLYSGVEYWYQLPHEEKEAFLNTAEFIVKYGGF